MSAQMINSDPVLYRALCPKTYDFNVVKSLIEGNADVHSRYYNNDDDSCGHVVTTETCFHRAVKTTSSSPDDDGQLIALFLQRGINPNETYQYDYAHGDERKSSSVNYPIHHAVEGGSYNITKALLDAKADVNAVSSQSSSSYRYGEMSQTTSTCLHIACKHNHLRLAELLLSYGADVNADSRNLQLSDDENVFIVETPIHIAIDKKSGEMMRLLMAFNANLKIDQKVGNSVEDFLRLDSSPSGTVSCLTLCGDDEVLRGALNKNFVPQNFKLEVRAIQSGIMMLLLVEERLLGKKFPTDVNFKIFTYILNNWYT